MKPKQRSTAKTPATEPQSGVNRLLWVVMLALIAGGTIANFHFGYLDWALRAAAGIVLAAVLVAVALQTSEGKIAWVFIKSARGELRKVVWPTRQETLHTTLIVVVMVIITAMVLWGLDTLFLWLVSLLTGQRG